MGVSEDFSVKDFLLGCCLLIGFLYIVEPKEEIKIESKICNVCGGSGFIITKEKGEFDLKPKLKSKSCTACGGSGFKL